MKLVRYGAPGREKPGIIAEDGKIRDLSRVVKDIDGAMLASGGLNKIKKLNPDVLTLDVPDGDWDIEVTTPNGTFSASGLTVSGSAGYEFDWADFSGADAERHLLSATFAPA